MSLSRLGQSRVWPIPTRICRSCQSQRLNSHFIRWNSSSTTPGKKDKSSGSIFNSSESAWDQVFKGIDDLPPIPTSIGSQNLTSGSRPRRQTMTSREMNAFDEMFNMIFDSVNEKNSTPTTGDPSFPAIDGPIGELYGKLRKHAGKLKLTTAEDEELDRMKEAMNMCRTDEELLQWAMKEVFGETEQLSRQDASTASSSTDGQLPTSEQVKDPEKRTILHSPAFSHLLASLMRTFRNKYNDPHLSLAIFDHARTHSIESYVFGCTTPAYNELIQTRWTHLRDLRGVHDTLIEMRANGVNTDSTTKKIVEQIRRDIQEQNIWIDEGHELDGAGSVLDMVGKIEVLALQKQSQAKKRLRSAFSGDIRASPSTITGRKNQQQNLKWDDWKGMSMQDDESDEWGFGKWVKPQEGKSRRPYWNETTRKGYGGR
ncbi:hypothetical protein BDN72DRAFT_833010 [Pluteus cervinus]|uniref:Uncharacterized protein n=1 Tax=Pluteus cervinus TaxID=181527 RepID=A0ACD3B942_9AGAR|nr:hypothetical protein BDN72DRAFT_833010 [Pluteus cervinus]